MAHITGLSLNNFKVFSTPVKFEFAPITILTGGNNTGKSSVLKALLLLDDNAKRTEFLSLDVSGDRHNLDAFEYAVNNKTNSKEIEIGFELSAMPEIYLDALTKFHVPNHGKLEIRLKYVEHENQKSGKLISYELRSGKDTILSVNYDLHEGHSLSLNYEWLHAQIYREDELKNPDFLKLKEEIIRNFRLETELLDRLKKWFEDFVSTLTWKKNADMRNCFTFLLLKKRVTLI
jgi:AAA15 family ATPase/GTPase